MSGPALSGRVSSATAHGYLPQYRGSANSSLSPAIQNGAAGEHDVTYQASKVAIHHEPIGPVSYNVAKGPENLPLSRAIPIVRPSIDSLDAEGYMRYLQTKTAEDQKLQIWDPSNAGTGPVVGSDW